MNPLTTFIKGLIHPVVTVYGVYVNRDMTEGRGPMELRALFSDEDEAWKFADTMKGVMGVTPRSGSWRNEGGGGIDVRPISLFAEAADLTKEKVEEERRQAWNKLTARERQLLGLSETTGRIGGRAGDII